MNKIHKHITVGEKHEEWIEKKAINLSKWVRKKIEEEMEDEN